MPIKSLLTEEAVLPGAGRVLVRDLISTIDAAVDEVQIVYFDVVASAQIVRVLILLLRHDVGVDVVEWAVRVQTVLVQVVRPPISHSLAGRHFVVVVLELVIVAAVDIA